ncbi:MAG: hypothetical protein JW715_07545 [Sedimentisphaerales bacterium]|nr:hypothetical protein [Sedimentisphaerales bacterium]
MKKIIIYFIAWIIASMFLMVWQHFVELPAWYLGNLLWAQCTIMGIIGGLMYCLRAVFRHKCVKDDWDIKWEVWYYLRPVTSAISGLVSFIFMKAGLLVLDATINPDHISYGYLAIAFIAGYNVDNFMKKLEEVALSIWGIKKSRASQEEDVEANQNKTN